MANGIYTLTNHEQVIDNSGRRYILKIRDRRPEDKPRERLINHGASLLSTPELLAIILGTGTIKEEVLQMTSRIIRDYGEKILVSHKNPVSLSDDLGIPVGKAVQIVACAELGRRFYSRNENGSPVLRSGSEVFEYVKEMGALVKEHLRGIYLNADYKVIHDEVISMGTLDANIVHPREVFKPAIEYSAAAVILVHNHPSGSIEPSEADIQITNQLISAGKIMGIDLIDHIIVTRNSFSSVPSDFN